MFSIKCAIYLIKTLLYSSRKDLKETTKNANIRVVIVIKTSVQQHCYHGFVWKAELKPSMPFIPFTQSPSDLVTHQTPFSIYFFICVSVMSSLPFTFGSDSESTCISSPGPSSVTGIPSTLSFAVIFLAKSDCSLLAEIESFLAVILTVILEFVGRINGRNDNDLGQIDVIMIQRTKG